MSSKAGAIQFLVRQITEWSQSPSETPRNSKVQEFFDTEASRADDGVLASLSEVLPVVTLSRLETEQLGSKLGDIRTFHPERTLALLPLLLASVPEAAEAVASLIRFSLVSDDRRVVRGGCHAITTWIAAYTKNSAHCAPPSELLTELGYGLAIRRPGILLPALELVAGLLNHMPKSCTTGLVRDAIHALTSLHNEANYDGVLSKNSEIDLPLLRLRCVELALALKKIGHSETSVVQEWLLYNETNALPEIRNVISKVGSIDEPVVLY